MRLYLIEPHIISKVRAERLSLIEPLVLIIAILATYK